MIRAEMISGVHTYMVPSKAERGNTFPEVMDISFRIARSKASDVAGEGAPCKSVPG